MSELAASGERLVVRFKKLGCCVKNQDCQIEDREKIVEKKELPLSLARDREF